MYVRRVLTMHRPDGDACGVAVWQERDGEVRLTLQGVHPTQEGLRVVVVEPGRAQDVGNWTPGEVFTASVAPGRGQGVALCGPDGRVTAAGFLPGCAQSALALRARVAHALGLGEAKHDRAEENEPRKVQETDTPVGTSAPPSAVELLPHAAGPRTLVFRGGVCIGQRVSGPAWPPPPLAPDAPYRDGAFHIDDAGLTEA